MWTAATAPGTDRPGNTLQTGAGPFCSVDSAATIRIVADDGSDAPILRSYVFNQDGENEFGMSSAPVDDATYPSTGARVAVMTSPNGFRDNLDATSGSDGLDLACTYANGAGGNKIAFNWIIPPNTTQQRSLNALLGLTPEPNSRITCDYENGSGILLLARNHNHSNDPARDMATVIGQATTEPRIVGIDYNGDGVADNIDADGNGVLDHVINLSCSAPFNYEDRLIVTGATGPVNYFGEGLPQWMGVDSGTGVIGANPDCSDAGQIFRPDFYVSGMTTSMTIQYRVGD